MTNSHNIYNFVSFNCKNVKRSIDDIRQLCRTAHVISLQETWLLPGDIDFLSDIDAEFAYTGTSAVDTSAGMLRGRPYGGVAILWNKKVFQNVSVVQCDNARVCAIKITMGPRTLLVFSLYLPTDDLKNLAEFTDCLSLASAISSSEDVESVYLLGDFNAHPNTLFYSELTSFCFDLEWMCADVELLGLSSDTYSFISEANGSRRWLDHCVVTKAAMQTVVKASVKYDVMWSDHFPLVIECKLNLIKPKLVCDFNDISNRIRWGERKPEQIELYSKICNDKFRLIDFPTELTFCSDKVCNESNHRQVIDGLYIDVINILSDAATCSHAARQSRKKKSVIGWNKHVRDAHGMARCKFDQWVLYGKPKSGRIWNEMHESRRVFKSRLRWCQNNSEQIKMDILASHHVKGDFRSFWKTTNKLNRKPGLPVSVNGVNDHKCIADLFKDHFVVKSPLGLSQSVCKGGCHGQEINARFLAKDVDKVIKTMSRGKSPGCDGLSIEHLKHAGFHLPRVLAMFYNACIGHSYLPAEMLKTVVVPITKSKTGDISDKSNYRPISLATILAKVLDGLLNTQLDKYLNIHENQFGFKAGLSTETAILCLKQTVRYYTDRKTPVFACFLDLSKAFDLVHYDILWQKLVNISMPSELIQIFQYWYQNQVNVVRWASAYSTPYGLECGVRQGGLTSPKLFNLYVNALIQELSTTHVGCHVDDICLNNISYADDMVLLSASVCGLSKLLRICEQYALSHGLCYNAKKSECMVFGVRGNSTDNFPSVKMNSTPLRRVDQFKYLGHLVTSDLKDNADIERERRALSVRANMIARRFARCSRDVKITLFRAFCTSMYTSSLWVSHTLKQYNALRVQYNNAFRVLMGLPRFCSASGMFAEARVDCFHTTMRKRCTSLVRRVRASSSRILETFAERFDCQYLNHCCMVHVLKNAAS